MKNIVRAGAACPLFAIILFLAFAAYGQQTKRIAIMNTEDDGEPPIKNTELTHLTDKLREIANKILPRESYTVMTQQSIVAFLGSQENMVKECREAEGCLAKLGRKINADYIGQARIGRFGKTITIKVELYESGSGGLVNSFTAESKDIYGLLSVLDKKAPDLFKQMLGVLDNSNVASPAVVGKAADKPDDMKSFTDARDGKKYRAVAIGKQTWMAENLNYNAKGSKCYGEGGKVYNSKTKKFDITLSKAEIQANCKKYGRLYNWATAMEACPKGWRLPSDEDWNVLMKFVNPSCSDNSYCDGAGTKLKATNGWNSIGGKSGNVTDDYGFSALPGGDGNSSGGFNGVGGFGYWWSASEDDSNGADFRGMYYFDEDAVDWDSLDKDGLFSVRCVKD